MTMPLRVQSAPRVRVPQPYWGYEDIGIFFFALVFLASVVRLGVRRHLLPRSELVTPTLGVQCAIIILLSIALYVVLKCRHHLPVVAPLGWVVPNVFYTAIAPVAGIAAALGIALLIHLRHQVMPTTPVIDFLVLGLVLGPILEESVFRGCLLPVVARTFGGAFAVIATALLFAVFHGPTDLAHWCWFTATGVAYGWLRLASQTTTAAAFMHATDNLTLFLAARL
jgi:membrane protease YdiL (CAAX protease family)